MPPGGKDLITAHAGFDLVSAVSQLCLILNCQWQQGAWQIKTKAILETKVTCQYGRIWLLLLNFNLVPLAMSISFSSCGYYPGRPTVKTWAALWHFGIRIFLIGQVWGVDCSYRWAVDSALYNYYQYFFFLLFVCSHLSIKTLKMSQQTYHKSLSALCQIGHIGQSDTTVFFNFVRFILSALQQSCNNKFCMDTIVLRGRISVALDIIYSTYAPPLIFTQEKNHWPFASVISLVPCLFSLR